MFLPENAAILTVMIWALLLLLIGWLIWRVTRGEPLYRLLLGFATMFYILLWIFETWIVTTFREIAFLHNEISVEAIVAPVNLVGTVLGVLIAFLVMQLGLPRFRNKTQHPYMVADAAVRDAIRDVFTSSPFLHALNESLPRGEHDEEYGLDYIPFMLKSIRQRRQRFRGRATAFLVGAISLSVVFGGIVFVFGLIVVNDEFSGTSRLLRTVTQEVRTSRAMLASLAGTPIGNNTYTRIVGPPMDTVLQLEPGGRNREAGSLLNASIRRYRSASGAHALDSLVALQLSRLSRETPVEARYAAAVAELQRALAEYFVTFDGALEQLNLATDALNGAVPAIRRAAESEEVQTSELIKRIAVGVIVCTFFLAILRFLAHIYRDNYSEMVRAEEDELRVRRFYVALKTTAGRPDDLRSVVTTFLSGNSSLPGFSAQSAAPEITREEATVLREFIQALLKKL